MTQNIIPVLKSIAKLFDKSREMGKQKPLKKDK
jgi:hypothetical protein